MFAGLGFGHGIGRVDGPFGGLLGPRSVVLGAAAPLLPQAPLLGPSVVMLLGRLLVHMMSAFNSERRLRPAAVVHWV